MTLFSNGYGLLVSVESSNLELDEQLEEIYPYEVTVDFFGWLISFESWKGFTRFSAPKEIVLEEIASTTKPQSALADCLFGELFQPEAPFFPVSEQSCLRGRIFVSNEMKVSQPPEDAFLLVDTKSMFKIAPKSEYAGSLWFKQKGEWLEYLYSTDKP